MSKSEMMTNYNQSEVLDIIKELVLSGKAYRCFTLAQDRSQRGAIRSGPFVELLETEGSVHQ